MTMTGQQQQQQQQQQHLETIDYQPPPPPSSTTQSLPTNPAKPSSEMTLDSSADHHNHRGGGDYHHDDDDDDDDDARYDLYSEEAEWDEGGKSHCGYSDMMHHTLMSVGGAVYRVVGEPSPRVEKELKAVGNWFQEASYAARDLVRGPNEGDNGEPESGSSGMREDAWDAVKTLVTGGPKNKNKKSDNPANDSNNHNTTSTPSLVAASN